MLEYKNCGKCYTKTTFRPRLFADLMGQFDTLVTSDDTPNRMMGRIIKDTIGHIEEYRNIPPVDELDERGLKVKFMGWFLHDEVVKDTTKNELGHIEYVTMSSIKNSFYGIYGNKYYTFIIYYETKALRDHEFYIVEAEMYKMSNNNGIPEIIAKEGFPVFGRLDVEGTVYDHKMIMEGSFKKPSKTYPNKPKEKLVYHPFNYIISDVYNNILSDLLEPVRSSSNEYSNISPLKSMLPLSTNEAESILSKYNKTADKSSRYYLLFSNIILDEDIPRSINGPETKPYTCTWMVLEISSYRDTNGRKLSNHFIYSIKQMGGVKLETNPTFINIG